ncbi:MAG: aminotransferase class I/II-fold pyridoxal phosphate-dependent enzyme [Saccharofermentanales bacterium]
MNERIQHKAPIYEALMDSKTKRIVSFDVPGHKQGRSNNDLTEFLGKQCLSVDFNSRQPLDNLCHPVSVIREAEEIAADAFGASNAFFMVNGTTSAVQAMILSVCKNGEKIILPRNVHRSAINALVVSGAEPVYVNPGVDKRLGIPLGMNPADVEKAILENPDAKAVFVNNPTYYGICSDIESLSNLAHKHGMYLLADEAHGTHYYFGDNLPRSAMSVKADMAAVSMHKTGGSLTQSSFLLTGEQMHQGHVRQIINLTQTTSGSYLLLSSLDLSRRDLALNGKKIFGKVLEIAEYARNEIRKIGGYYPFSDDLENGADIFAYDKTKLSIYTRDIGLAGKEVHDILRDKYDIQIELGDLANILAIISVGDRSLEIERLVAALSEIKRLYSRDKAGMFDHEYITPIVEIKPKKAFYADKHSMPLEKSCGQISGEFIMAYPPGIPILAPGERITREILDYISYSKEKGCFLTGTEDMKVENINVVEV